MMVGGCPIQVSPAKAHTWDEFNPKPDAILERLVETLEAAAEADRFKTSLSSDCVPHHCLEGVLNAVSEADFDWLANAPEAEIPSDIFRRLPANMTYEWLFDLVVLLDLDAPTDVQTALAGRVEAALNHWKTS